MIKRRVYTNVRWISLFVKNKFRTVLEKLEIKDPPGFLKPDDT